MYIGRLKDISRPKARRSDQKKRKQTYLPSLNNDPNKCYACVSRLKHELMSQRSIT